VFARVGATNLGTDAHFIVTNLEGCGKTLYEKVFCTRGQAENLIKDMKRFTPNALPASSDLNAVNTANQIRPRSPSIILANRMG
jgi:Transposase DDE domain group 1